MIRLAVILLAVSLISGCSGAPKKSEAKISTEKAVRLPVVSADLNQASQTLCPKIGADISKKKLKELIQMGNSCMRLQEYGRLEEVGRMLTRVEPLQPWGSFFMSVSAEARGEIPRAKWMIELAMKKNPSYGILYFQKGRLLWMDKQQAEAIRTIKKALELDSNLTEGHLFLGNVFYRDQEYELASEHYFAVLKAQPSNIHALSGLADSRRYRGDFRGAMEILNRAINYHPDSLELYLRQAQIHESNMNDSVNALNAYIQLKRKLQRSPSASIRLADIESKIQQLEKLQRKPAVSTAKAPVENMKPGSPNSGKGVKP